MNKSKSAYTCTCSVKTDFACCKIEYLLESQIGQLYLQTQVEKCVGGTFNKTSTSAVKILRCILRLLRFDFFYICKIPEYAEMCNSLYNFLVHVLCSCQNYGGICSIFNHGL